MLRITATATRSIIQRRCFASVDICALQRAHWNTYMATGRGSAALFATIDKDSDKRITVAELRAFLSHIEPSGSLPRVHKLLELAEEDTLTFNEFQRWLVLVTEETTSETCKIQPWYESQPVLGDRSVMGRKDDRKVYTWNESSMSQQVRRMQYAVRGEVVMRAEQLASEGKDIIYTNIGNPQAVGQPPITFYRQILALCDLPAQVGVDHPQASTLFPEDVLERAREMRDLVGTSGTGAYTHSQGLAPFRRHVADYIAHRDGHPAFPGDIFLTNGASHGIELILTSLISCNSDAIMIPIPQYPIYSALITKLGGRKVGYELDESIGWGIIREELYRRLDESRKSGLNVRGLALINPGNPTGQVMTRRDLATICRFCADNGIVLMADEVYQRNVYVPDKYFISAKKVAVETPECGDLQLISFHSTSKGFIGECGRRGGYMELHNIDPYVQSRIYKLASSGLCSGTAGQIVTSLMVRGPEPGTESEILFHEEEGKIYKDLARRSQALVKGLNEIEGIECQRAEGAMYAFPRIELPQGALEEARRQDKTPDTLYALSLVDETGICVVPASGFGQREGRVGFRTTFLPGDKELERAVSEFKRHHEVFFQRYMKSMC